MSLKSRCLLENSVVVEPNKILFMTLEESCNYIEQIAKDPFQIKFMDDEEKNMSF